MRKGTIVGAACAVLAAGAVLASSHREAPFVTKNPKVDGTDFYLFRSYEPGRDAFVTMIANYVPRRAHRVLFAGALAQPVDGAAARHRGDPGGRRAAFRPVVACAPPDFDERVLHHLFRFLSGSQDAHRDRHRPPGESVVRRAQRTAIAARNPRDDLFDSKPSGGRDEDPEQGSETSRTVRNRASAAGDHAAASSRCCDRSRIRPRATMPSWPELRPAPAHGFAAESSPVPRSLGRPAAGS